MTPLSTRLRRAGFGIATAAVVGSGLIVPPMASASTTHVVTDLDVNTDDSRTLGHTEFLADGGVHVWTEDNSSQSKVAGYFAVNTPLADAGEPELGWSLTDAASSTAEPGLQLVVDFDGNGSADGILVGETVYGNDWWLSNSSAQFAKDGAPSHEGGSGSANHGTLDQWRTAFPHASVALAGWSLGSGVKGDGVISDLELGDTTYTFAKAARSNVTVPSTSIDFGETRTKGHHEFTKRGVEIWTEDNSSQSKAAGYFAVSTPLAKAGEPTWDLTAAAGAPVPGKQLVVDFDGNGSADGILVGEDVYGKDWWLSNSSAQFVKDAAPSHVGGAGSDNHGTLWRWRAVFPNAQVLAAGWSLGSGVKGDVRLNSMTVGATTYSFVKNVAPVAPALGSHTVAGVAATVTLDASDADGDALTYATSTPGATISGRTLTVAVAPSFVGTKDVTYTATDANGVSATNTVRVWVTRAPSTVTQVVPTTIRRGKTVSVRIKATSTGAVDRGVVDVYLNGRKVRTTRVSAAGTAKVSLGKGKKGTYKVVTRFRGTHAVDASRTAKAIVRVK